MGKENENPLRLAGRILRADGLLDGSLMETATFAEVLVTIPPLRRAPEVVALAARLGGNCDDCFDVSLDRREGQEALAGGRALAREGVYPEKHRDTLLSLIEQVQKAPFKEEDRLRIVGNSLAFTANLATVELQALAIPMNEWSWERAIEYRKAVCLLWATYFASLGSSDIQLNYFEEGEGIDGPMNHYSHYLTEDHQSARWIRRLYHGSLVFQLISDWHSRDINRERMAPGFGSTGQEGEVSQKIFHSLFEEFIETARKNGMSLFEEATARYLFPVLEILVKAREGRRT